MNHLRPEKRLDKNGRLVTRYVSPALGSSLGKPIPHTTAPSDHTKRYTCSECRAVMERGYNHRCPSPSLVPLTPAAQKVIDACTEAGCSPLLVGGSVRDALLSKSQGKPFTPKDYDIEIRGLRDPQTLREALLKLGTVNSKGTERGIFRAEVDGESFDILTPRTSYHHADNDSSEIDDVEAFGRRDYTVNSMGWDPYTQELVDPYGGASDLKNRTLRFTSNNVEPIFMLRGFQFAARFGMSLDKDSAEKASALQDRFDEIPPNRVWQEFDKFFSKGEDITAGLRAIYDSGWEGNFPELAAVRGVPQDPVWHPEGSVEVHLGLSGDAAVRIAERDGLNEEQRRLIVLAATLHDLGKADTTVVHPDGKVTSHGHEYSGEPLTRSFLKRINAPVSLRDKVVPLVKEHMCHHSIDKPSFNAVRRFVRRLEGEDGRGPTVEDWLRVTEADAAGRAEGSKESSGHVWAEMAQQVPASGPQTIVTGKLLIQLGLEPGVHFSEIISDSALAQDENKFDDESGAKLWLQKYLSQKSSI